MYLKLPLQSSCFDYNKTSCFSNNNLFFAFQLDLQESRQYVFHKGSSYCTQLDLTMSLVSKKYVKFNKTVSQISVTLQSVMENSLVSFGVSPFQSILSVSSISDVQGTEIYHCQLVYDPCLFSNLTHRVQIGLCQFSWYIKALLNSFGVPLYLVSWHHTSGQNASIPFPNVGSS